MGDYEDFLALRKHVRKLQGGTPLLLHTNGEDDLQICTFAVSQDLQALTWRRCEGGSACRLPLAAIAAVDVSSPGTGGHFALKVQLRERQANLPQTLELICTSKDDLESWHQGLRFLIGDGAAESATADLEQKLKWQEQLIERLQQENNMLREIVKRKDATIADLLRDQNKSIKTESTSRESDEHLQYREVAILRRKNKRLQNELKSKQQTISGLLKLVDRLSQQADAETSAQETAEEEVEVNPKDSRPPEAKAEPKAEAPRDAAAQAREAREAQAMEALEVRQAQAAAAQAAAAAAAAAAQSAQSAQSASAPAAAQMAQMAQLLGGSPSGQGEVAKMFMGEMAGLAEKLQMLEKAAASAPAPAFQPPSRAPRGKGPKSAQALEALQREFDALENKKRVVQHLAHTLEPEPSDSEDDGFPLR
ncbi:unnamed protein product [Effrenium voratum]|nr:unnamed protein product [Effrenium voratum]